MHISSKCSLAVHCLIFLHEFGEGNRINSEIMAKSTGANPVVIRKILSALKKDGIVETQSAHSGTKIACPLQEITLLRICRAIEPGFLSKLIGVHPSPSNQCIVGRNIYPVLEKTYAAVKADMEKSLAKITMQDIIENYHETIK